MNTVEIRVTPTDAIAGVKRYLAGQKLAHSCPVQRALQSEVDRPAIVFRETWHLGSQDKVPATKGVRLPSEAVSWIAAFDAWCGAIQARTRRGEELEDVLADIKAPKGLTCTVAVPA